MPDDPYKYFRIEARELVESLGQGALELEKSGGSADLVGRLLRYAHTLKGAARIVKQPHMSELSHSIEDLLAPHREGSPVPSRRARELLALVDRIEAGLRSLDVPPAPGPAISPSPASEEAGHPSHWGGDERFESLRVAVGEMDGLLSVIAQAGVQTAALGREAEAADQAIAQARALAGLLAGPRAGETQRELAPVAESLVSSLRRMRKNLGTAAERLERELADAHGRAGELRLLPVSSLAGVLRRSVRDAAESLHRRVEFEMSGGENRLDAHVLRALRDGLVHMVRNAVAHGIEPEAQRVAAGKPPVGRVYLEVERRGSRISLTCRDDGQGVGVEQVRRAAVERGLISAEQVQAMDSNAVAELILLGGMTTARTVTQMAGRGIGLDIVRAAVQRLKGEIHVYAEAGRGTAIELLVPVSLESLAVLEVRAGGRVLSIPIDAVVGAVRAKAEDIVHSTDGESLLYEGHTVRFAALGSLLGPGTGADEVTGPFSVVVVRSGAIWVAVGVDRVVRAGAVMVRPLPELSGRVGLIAGASFDSEGNPQLVLDPAGLGEALLQRRSRAVSRPADSKPPLLVIDDSLTTRMLEQSILETAGYEVELADSAEEGLEKARRKRYGMFIVDVEMPGMDGFDFVGRVQADPELRNTPSILVTSRAAAEDRARGLAAGARGYIVKSEFDEGHLLSTIRRLVG